VLSGFSRFRERLVASTPSLQPEHSTYPWLVLVATCIATFMGVLDSTIVNVALNKLTVAFGVSTDTAEWVLTAYMLAFGVMLPASGWLADHLGYKTTFLSGVFLFTLGSFLCSMSWDMSSLIFFRVVQALGAGVIMPVGMALIMREFPPAKRGVALGFWSISSAASASLGPTIGGYLIDNYSWHTIFDVNVPVGILALLAGFIVLREHRSEKTRSFDIVGLIAMVIFLCGLNLALADGNAAWNTDGWTSTFILFCFGAAVVGLAVFLVIESTIEHPLIDLSLFKELDFSLGNIVLFIFGLGMFGSTFLLPLYLQSSLGFTPLQAGMVFLPMGILTALSSPLSGMINDKIGARVPIIIGLSLMASSLFVNRYLSLFSDIGQVMIPICMRGFGMGFIFAPLSAVSISRIPQQKMAQASGLTNILRQIGGSFGIALFGTMLTTRVKFHIGSLGQAVSIYSPSFNGILARLSRFAMETTGGTAGTAMSKAQALLMVRLSKLAFVAAVSDVFTIAAIVTASAIIPVLLLKESHRKAGGPKPVIID
jgi:MFS transporter, DHA2 family, multidrug resistance protein